MGLFDFRRKPGLISLHIPKTAGTSFRNMLKSVYGEDQVVRFDINERGEVRLDEALYEKDKLPGVRVIHGHFVFADLERMYKLPSDYQLITWLRDPVARVVSNYYYLESRLKELLDEERRNLNIRSKMQRSLIEYARAELNRNRQSKFLRGIEIEQMDFVGIQEHFSTEIPALAACLAWKSVPENLHHNPTASAKPDIPDAVLAEIRELNAEDQAIYERGLALRKARSAE